MANPLHKVGKGSVKKVTGAFRKLPKGSVAGFGIGAAIETASSLNEGKGIGTSVARGLGTGLLEEVVGFGPFLAINLASSAPALFQAGISWNKKLAGQHMANRDPGNMNFSYQDTQQAYTMRQSAVQAIQGSKMNARSALGGEARLMHKRAPR